MYDETKGAYNWSGKFLNLTANKNSSEGQSLYGQKMLLQIQKLIRWMTILDKALFLNKVLHVMYVCIDFI